MLLLIYNLLIKKWPYITIPHEKTTENQWKCEIRHVLHTEPRVNTVLVGLSHHYVHGLPIPIAYYHQQQQKTLVSRPKRDTSTVGAHIWHQITPKTNKCCHKNRPRDFKNRRRVPGLGPLQSWINFLQFWWNCFSNLLLYYLFWSWKCKNTPKNSQK